MKINLRNTRRMRQLGLIAAVLAGWIGGGEQGRLVAESGLKAPTAHAGLLQNADEPLTPIGSTTPGAQGDPAVSTAPVLSSREIYQRMLKSVVFLVQGDSHGTGWVLDAERGLIVTNDHVVRGGEQVEVRFPLWTNGELDTDLGRCLDQTPQVGEVVDSHYGSDLAIVRIATLPAGTMALPLASASASPGERVHAIGGYPRGSMGMWKYSSGSVGQVAELAYDGHQFRVMQSNIDINPGNSGGAIVNDCGQVVGVCQSIDLDARDVSNNVDISHVRQYLDTVLPLLTSDTPEALVAMGTRHRDAGRSNAALKCLSEALQRNPNLAQARAERGWVFLNMQDHVTALQDFNVAVAQDETLVSAWRGRAMAYRRMNDWTNATADLSKAISCDPQIAVLYNERAIALEFSESYELALADYTRAIQLQSDELAFLANRADLLIKLNRLEEARQDLVRTLELNDDFAWAHFLLGRVYYRSQDYTQALTQLLRANELAADNLEYLALLGECVQQLNDHEAGVKIWGRLIELEPQSAYNYYSRAWSYRRLGQLQLALTDLNRAIELKDSDASYYKERGLAYQALGDEAQANADFARAQALDPQSTVNVNTVSPSNPSTESPTVTYRPPVADPSATPSHVGRWYVNQVHNGVGIEATQVFAADGSYEAVLIWTDSNGTQRVDERGTYLIQGDRVEFNTNLGRYSMQFKMKDGLLWLLFEARDLWVGSSRATN